MGPGAKIVYVSKQTAYVSKQIQFPFHDLLYDVSFHKQSSNGKMLNSVKFLNFLVFHKVKSTTLIF